MKLVCVFIVLLGVLMSHLSSAQTVEPLLDRVSAFGARYGVAFAWDRVRRTPPTVASHALLAWADERHRRRLLEERVLWCIALDSLPLSLIAPNCPAARAQEIDQGRDCADRRVDGFLGAPDLLAGLSSGYRLPRSGGLRESSPTEANSVGQGHTLFVNERLP